jgi:class 3 adenylate cyclase
MIWGDTVNLASRMESAAPVGGILISEPMNERLAEGFVTAYRGEIEMKGKGLQRAWLLEERRDGT